MRWGLIGFVGAMFCAVAGYGAEIVSINSLRDLPKVAPILLADGTSVRIGLCEPEPADAPWQILYCLAEGPAGKAVPLHMEGPIPGEVLGPVFYRCSWDEQKRAKDQVKVAVQGAADTGPLLFYAVVPLAWKGVCHVRIMNRAGEELLVKDITVAGEPAVYWQTFVASNSRERPDAPYRIEAEPVAALPEANGLEAMAFADVGSVAGEQLSLKLEQGCFVIRSEKRKMAALPALNLLARWWVNDKPLVAARPDKGPEGMSINGMIGHTHEMKIALGLPTTLGKVSVGDRVSLQLLYAPGGHEELQTTPIRQMQQMMQAVTREAVMMPTLSNRLSFVVTQEMLANGRR